MARATQEQLWFPPLVSEQCRTTTGHALFCGERQSATRLLPSKQKIRTPTLCREPPRQYRDTHRVIAIFFASWIMPASALLHSLRSASLDAGIIATLLVSSLLLTPHAQAHEIRPAYLKLTQIGADEAASLVNDVDFVAIQDSTYFEASLRQPQIDGRFLGLDLGTNCISQLTSANLSGEALIEVSLLSCGDGGLQQIDILGLDRTMIDALVSIKRLDGSESNHLITAQETSLDLSSTAATLPAYLLVGFEHLVLGYDHILFVLMLLYLVTRPRQIFWVVTSFTLAHSLTLALSALGFVIVAQLPIEAAIAGSIVLLAYETLSDRQSLSHRFPALVAFSFGLIHGLGFAGALSEIGLPEDSRLGALLLFNVGIELGKIVIVIAVLALLFLLRKALGTRVSMGSRQVLRALPAVAIGGVASYWFFERALQILSPLLS